MKISLIQFGDYTTLFKAFMIPSGFSSSAQLWHITSHYFLLNLPIWPLGGRIRYICCSPAFEFGRVHLAGSGGTKVKALGGAAWAISSHYSLFVIHLNIHSSVNEQETLSVLFQIWYTRSLCYSIFVFVLTTWDALCGCSFTSVIWNCLFKPEKYCFVQIWGVDCWEDNAVLLLKIVYSQSKGGRNVYGAK